MQTQRNHKQSTKHISYTCGTIRMFLRLTINILPEDHQCVLVFKYQREWIVKCGGIANLLLN